MQGTIWPPTLDRAGDPLDRAGLHQPSGGKAQLHAVQVKIEPGRLHGGQASDGVPGWLTGPLFANLPGGAGEAFERTVISTVHASIFANILARRRSRCRCRAASRLRSR
jgi:hypothetical protein